MTKNRIQEQKIPRGYKETKIGLIPDDWDCVRLDDMGHLSKGAGISKSEVQENGLPAVRYGELYTCYDTQINYVHSFINETSALNSKVIKRGDILFAGSGETVDEIGKSAIYLGGNEAYAGGDIIIFSPKNKDSLCIAYLLNSQIVRRELRRLGQGQSIVHIYKPDISKLYLPVPPIQEQKKIADILDRWDSAISKIEKLISVKRKLKKALCQQLLTGKYRFEGFKTPWKECRLGDIVKIIERPVEWDEDRLYQLASVRRWSGGMFIREERNGHQIKVKKLRTIKEGDFLISHIQSAYGSMALVPKEFDGMHVSELYTVLLPKNPDEFDIRYLAYMSQDKYIWHLAYLASNGFFAERLRLNFNPEDFLKHKIKIPADIKEQGMIIDILNSVSNEIVLLSQKLELLKQQKRGLMQKLLTGKIRVKT